MIKWKIVKGTDEKYKELQIVLDILKAKKELSFFEEYFKDVLDDSKIHYYQPPRKLKCHWKIETSADIQCFYSQEVIDDLAKEIEKEIDLEVLKAMMNYGKMENQ